MIHVRHDLRPADIRQLVFRGQHLAQPPQEAGRAPESVGSRFRALSSSRRYRVSSNVASLGNGCSGGATFVESMGICYLSFAYSVVCGEDRVPTFERSTWLFTPDTRSRYLRSQARTNVEK